MDPSSPEYAQQNHIDLVKTPCIVFLVVTPIFVAIRVYNRIVKKSNFGLDDVTLFAAMVCNLTCEILMLIAEKYGWGRHISTLPTAHKLYILELFYVAQLFYKTTINLTKISILLLYLRIFVQKWFRISCYSLIGIVIAYLISSTAVSIWQCSPIYGAWDKSIHPKCINLTQNWYANAGFSISTDVFIILLPLHPIWTSKLPINQKRALIFVFLLGFFVTITSILRSTSINLSTTSPDTTYDIQSTLWTLIEENVAIICACLPMCRVVLAMILPSVFGHDMASAISGYKKSDASSGRYHNAGSFSAPGSQTSDWSPYDAAGHKQGTADMTRHSGAQSEEYILTTVHRQTMPEEEGVIVKTSKYEVSYESNGPQKS